MAEDDTPAFFFFFFFTCEEDCGLVIFWFPTYGRSAERNAQFHSVSVRSFGQFLFAFLGDGYREKDWKQNGDGTGARAKSVWFIVMISARLLAPRCIQMWLGDKVNLWKMHSILVPLPSAHWNASVNVSFFRLSRSSDRHLATHHHCFFFFVFFFSSLSSSSWKLFFSLKSHPRTDNYPRTTGCSECPCFYSLVYIHPPCAQRGTERKRARVRAVSQPHLPPLPFVRLAVERTY